MQELAPESVPILGIGITVFESYDNAVDVIRTRILSKIRTFCVAMNPEKLYAAMREPQLEQIIRSADIRICDGVGISLACLLVHHRRIRRCTGIDLFLKVIGLCSKEHLNVFMLGASPEINESGCRALLKAYPGLRIAGRHHGYFDDPQIIIDTINQSGADVVFVALGSPRQEFWISEHMPKLKSVFCMGIGGSLDVVSGSVRRAPPVFRTLGAEWLYRLLCQPSRLRRQTILPLFLIDVFKSMRQSRKVLTA